MTLGEKIYRLRTQNNLSKEALAEKMNVSRQSISKWETDASIPELDKLILLSGFFGISLDELVRQDTPKEKSSEKEENAAVSAPISAPQPPIRVQTMVGLIQFSIGLLGLLLSFFLNSDLILVLISSYILICGILCLCIKKYAAIVIGMMTAVILFFLFTVVLALPDAPVVSL